MSVSSETPVDDAIAAEIASGDEVHRWYRIIMGFDWQLANSIIEHLGMDQRSRVLDPFAGAGTTLVQCKKRNIEAIGLDVNPVCLLASRVKTNWDLPIDTATLVLGDILEAATKLGNERFSEDSALRYLIKSGMIERGWLSLYKARRVLALRRAIVQHSPSKEIEEFFLLSLVAAVVSRIADIKFGPELYVLREPKRAPVMASFEQHARLMIGDLSRIQNSTSISRTQFVIAADSRTLASRTDIPQADFIITSPPYPNEHDYTRSTRLELVLLGHVADLAGLQLIKKQMVRCSTKGVYKTDCESTYVSQVKQVEQIASSLDQRALDHTDGFSRLYGRMVREYFGGMARHFESIFTKVRPGGRCAYVVRDSKSLLDVYIDTPSLLADIAQSAGFQVQELVEWKRVKGTTGTKMLSEKVIYIRRPA